MYNRVDAMSSTAEKLTSCPRCKLRMVDPQRLPCDHSFCKRCITRMTKHNLVTCLECTHKCNDSEVQPDQRLDLFFKAFEEQVDVLSGAKAGALRYILIT